MSPLLKSTRINRIPVTPGPGFYVKFTQTITPSVTALYRIDFGAFHGYRPPETDPDGEFMHTGVSEQSATSPGNPSNNNWDIVAELSASAFGNDGVNTWNLMYETTGGQFDLTNSLGVTGNASIILPIAGGGSGEGQGDTINWMRAGYIDFNTFDTDFMISLGSTAIGKHVQLAWATLGNNQPYTSCITISTTNLTGVEPDSTQLDWGEGNLAIQTVVADASGNIVGSFVSTRGENSNNDLPLAGLQIYQMSS